MSKFQIIVTALFIICIIVGVTLFATYKSSSSTQGLPAITIWGTYPASAFTRMLGALNTSREAPLDITYIEIAEASFDKQFIEALANGQGPSALLIPQELLARHTDKILPIPASVLTERDFINTYIPQAELYFSAEREPYALPFTIDPLVMYWNRDLYTNAGIATYPKYWDEFNSITAKIDQKDVNSNIRRSAIAMGEFNNINNAREILGALLLQSGNPVTTRGDATSGGSLVSTLGDGQFSGAKLSDPAVVFYTQFANPRSSLYSWNRSLPVSKSWFLSGSLATYFGFASELFDLRAKNPNMNYDVAPLPQIREGNVRTTYGSMYGFSIVRRAPDPSSTYAILKELTSPEALSLLSKTSFLPPVRRDMISADSKDPYQQVFYDSALISRGWLDTNAVRTGKIFQTMVESITSGRAETYEAIQTAHESLDLSLQNP